jgi:hypothetical protein
MYGKREQSGSKLLNFNCATKGIWNGVVVDCKKKLFRHSPEGTTVNHYKSLS